MDPRAASNRPTVDGKPTGEITTFVELSGKTAGDLLAAYGKSVAEQGAACELLASETQENLFLLVCHGAEASVDGREDTGAAQWLPALPVGAKTWTFRMVEVYR
jgi:hypothetical protein